MFAELLLVISSPLLAFILLNIETSRLKFTQYEKTSFVYATLFPPILLKMSLDKNPEEFFSIISGHALIVGIIKEYLVSASPLKVISMCLDFSLFVFGVIGFVLLRQWKNSLEQRLKIENEMRDVLLSKFTKLEMESGEEMVAIQQLTDLNNNKFTMVMREQEILKQEIANKFQAIKYMNLESHSHQYQSEKELLGKLTEVTRQVQNLKSVEKSLEGILGALKELKFQHRSEFLVVHGDTAKLNESVENVFKSIKDIQDKDRNLSRVTTSHVNHSQSAPAENSTLNLSGNSDAAVQSTNTSQSVDVTSSLTRSSEVSSQSVDVTRSSGFQEKKKPKDRRVVPSIVFETTPN